MLEVETTLSARRLSRGGVLRSRLASSNFLCMVWDMSADRRGWRVEAHSLQCSTEITYLSWCAFLSPKALRAVRQYTFLGRVVRRGFSEGLCRRFPDRFLESVFLGSKKGFLEVGFQTCLEHPVGEYDPRGLWPIDLCACTGRIAIYDWAPRVGVHCHQWVTRKVRQATQPLWWQGAHPQIKGQRKTDPSFDLFFAFWNLSFLWLSCWKRELPTSCLPTGGGSWNCLGNSIPTLARKYLC